MADKPKMITVSENIALDPSRIESVSIVQNGIPAPALKRASKFSTVKAVMKSGAIHEWTFVDDDAGASALMDTIAGYANDSDQEGE